MSSNKRDDILNAALLLFVDKGFDGTKVPDIADKANVGTGTIYRYFESKEVLLNVLYQKWMTELGETAFHHAIYEEQDTRKQFALIFQKIIDYANKNIHALLFIDMHTGSNSLNETSQQMFDQFFGQLCTFLDKGKELGIIIDLPAEVLIAMVYGSILYLYRCILSGVLEQDSKLLETVEECCWNAIRVH